MGGRGPAPQAAGQVRLQKEGMPRFSSHVRRSARAAALLPGWAAGAARAPGRPRCASARTWRPLTRRPPAAACPCPRPLAATLCPAWPAALRPLLPSPASCTMQVHDRSRVSNAARGRGGARPGPRLGTKTAAATALRQTVGQGPVTSAVCSHARERAPQRGGTRRTARGDERQRRQIAPPLGTATTATMCSYNIDSIDPIETARCPSSAPGLAGRPSARKGRLARLKLCKDHGVD